MAVFDWYGWTGAASGSIVSSYLNAKTKPLTSRISNGNLTKLAIVAMQVFQIGTHGRANLAEAVDGASEWAVGSLVGDFITPRLIGTTTLPVAVAAPAAAAATAAATTAATGTSQPVGVTASGGSGAFDLPTPGY